MKIILSLILTIAFILTLGIYGPIEQSNSQENNIRSYIWPLSKMQVIQLYNRSGNRYTASKSQFQKPHYLIYPTKGIIPVSHVKQTIDGLIYEGVSRANGIGNGHVIYVAVVLKEKEFDEFMKNNVVQADVGSLEDGLVGNKDGTALTLSETQNNINKLVDDEVIELRRFQLAKTKNAPNM